MKIVIALALVSAACVLGLAIWPGTQEDSKSAYVASGEYQVAQSACPNGQCP